MLESNGKDGNKMVCDLCKSNDYEHLFSNHDRLFPKIKGDYDLYRCRKCGLIFLNQPSHEELYKHYPEEEYSVYNDSGDMSDLRKGFVLAENLYQYITWKKDESQIFKLVNYLFLPCRSFFRTSKVLEGGNYLDVGCGMGYFPMVMKNMGMKPYGVEPGEFDKKLSVEYNLNIFHGTLDDVKYNDNFFDVITMNHVMEHVEKPMELMKELNRILKSEGYLIIGVPVSDSLAFKIFGRYWSNLDTPRHLFTYSTDNLKLYAEKSGFEVEKIRYNSRPDGQFLNSFRYLMEDLTSNRYNPLIVYNIFLNLILLPITSILNLFRQGDQCQIILTKKNLEK